MIFNTVFSIIFVFAFYLFAAQIILQERKRRKNSGKNGKMA